MPADSRSEIFKGCLCCLSPPPRRTGHLPRRASGGAETGEGYDIVTSPHHPMPGVPRDTTRRIGLLGGSFNPAHDGHRHVSLEALRRLGLDEVWWLVSPQQPLKAGDGMEPV